MKEPRPRKDGTCYVCRKPRRLDQKPLYRDQAEVDPFCSRPCTELWYAEQRRKEDAA